MPGEKLVAIFHNLMATDNQVQAMLFCKLFNLFIAKNERCTPVTRAPAIFLDAIYMLGIA